MKTNNIWNNVIRLFLFIAIISSSGCALAIHGGSLVSKGDASIKEYLVTYRAEGSFPEGATYHLVKTEKGEAVFEQEKNGSGALLENHWEDSDGDHFASWIYLPGGGNSRHAYEFVIPKDRMKIALRYVYPWGTYVVQEINSIERPIPSEEVAPVATLIPVQSPLIKELELRDAARRCDIAKVDSILESDPGIIDARDGTGVAPLKYAAASGCLDVFNSLVAKGADVNLKDKNGVTPLLAAAANGRMEIAELLLSKGVDVNSKNKNGLNALHYAISNKQKEMAKMLIGKGCDVNAKEVRSVTPLHLAARNGDKEVAEMLISKGADVNAKDITNFTPLYYASKYKHKDLAKLLRSHGGIK